MDQVLDGKTPVKVVPFDHLEKIVRGSHEHGKEGYKPVPYVAPKAPEAKKEK